MLCFEIFRNGEKLYMAGVGDHGVLSTIVSWVAHHPAKLARWAKRGETMPASEPHISLSTGGLTGPQVSKDSQHLAWPSVELMQGDEILVRIVGALEVDPPAERYSSKEFDRRFKQAMEPESKPAARTRAGTRAKKAAKPKPGGGGNRGRSKTRAKR
jgi:hypothetical protein